MVEYFLWKISRMSECWWKNQHENCNWGSEEIRKKKFSILLFEVRFFSSCNTNHFIYLCKLYTSWWCLSESYFFISGFYCENVARPVQTVNSSFMSKSPLKLLPSHDLGCCDIGDGHASSLSIYSMCPGRPACLLPTCIPITGTV